MQNLLVLLAVLFTFALNAQARLGVSYNDVYEEYRYLTPTVTTEKQGLCLDVTTSTVQLLYYFNEDKNCKTTIICPRTQGILNGYVEKYNNSYVIVSNTEWKMYSQNAISSIKLVTHEDLIFFVWE